MTDVMISPETQRLQEEIQRLKTELSMMVLEYDELRFVICENIKENYLLQFGDLEYQLLCTGVYYRRLKRKIEMIQAKINRQEIIDETLIDELLDVEFSHYANQLQKKREELAYAMECSELETLTDEEVMELKELYRKIVKRVHPDANPNVTEEELHYFEQAVRAYKNGDLEGLRLVEHVLDSGKEIIEPSSLEEMKQTIQNLDCSIQTILKKMEFIKGRFPYTAKKLLEDKQAIEERKNQLSKELKILETSIHEMKDKIQFLIMTKLERKGEEVWAA